MVRWLFKIELMPVRESSSLPALGHDISKQNAVRSPGVSSSRLDPKLRGAHDQHTKHTFLLL